VRYQAEIDDPIMERLFNCPFCESREAPQLMTAAEVNCLDCSPTCECQCHDQENSTFVVCCNTLKGGCGATAGYRKSSSEAITAWNRIAGDE
jgi:hypothetical protein